MPIYYGKYKAFIVDTNDPDKRGRIKVKCPSVLGEALSNWCEPCVPIAYDYGGDFVIPKVGEAVWVEFEEGNINKPIYTGGWWSTNTAPNKEYDPDVRIIEWNGCKITMSGKDDNAVLTLSAGGSSITVSRLGVETTPDITGVLQSINDKLSEI